MKQRGYCGIGVFMPKNYVNVGTLWRSAHILGADFIFTVNRRYKREASDTLRTPRHVPLFHYDNIDDLKTHLPWAGQLIGVELTNNASDLRQVAHPECAVYLLGAEDFGIPHHVLDKCGKVIRIPGEHSLNVSVAGSIVLYDRVTKGWK